MDHNYTRVPWPWIFNPIILNLLHTNGPQNLHLWHDILGTLTNDADKKLDKMFKAVNEEGRGAIIFINQQAQSLNLLNRLRGLKKNQEAGEMKAPSIVMDKKDFGIGAQILHDLHIHKLRLISNSQQTKRVGMIGYGLEIVDYVNY